MAQLSPRLAQVPGPWLEAALLARLCHHDEHLQCLFCKQVCVSVFQLLRPSGLWVLALCSSQWSCPVTGLINVLVLFEEPCAPLSVIVVLTGQTSGRTICSH